MNYGGFACGCHFLLQTMSMTEHGSHFIMTWFIYICLWFFPPSIYLTLYFVFECAIDRQTLGIRIRFPWLDHIYIHICVCVHIVYYLCVYQSSTWIIYCIQSVGPPQLCVCLIRIVHTYSLSVNSNHINLVGCGKS